MNRNMIFLLSFAKSTTTSRNPTGKNYPPSFTEVTEYRRIKYFSANLGVFGVYRREIFCFFCTILL